MLVIDDKTLNIFTDASVYGKIDKINKNRVCAGAIATDINKGRLREFQILLDKSTNNYGELTGIGLGIMLASIFRDKYDRINIFSDSQISVKGLREWIYGWINKLDSNGIMHSSSGTPVANHDLILSITDLILNNFIPGKHKIYLYHINGHITSDKDLRRGIRTFKKSNYINQNINDDILNYIKYLQRWNDYIDRSTRSSFYKWQYGVEYLPEIDINRFNRPLIYDLPERYSSIMASKYEL